MRIASYVVGPPLSGSWKSGARTERAAAAVLDQDSPVGGVSPSSSGNRLCRLSGRFLPSTAAKVLPRSTFSPSLTVVVAAGTSGPVTTSESRGSRCGERREGLRGMRRKRSQFEEQGLRRCAESLPRRVL